MAGWQPAPRVSVLIPGGISMQTLLIVLLAGTAAANEAAPTVSTRPAQALGQTAMTVNRSIQPYGLPTTYHFEYGPTDRYGSKTATVALPPRLAAYYHESFDDGPGGWMSWCKATHFKTGGAKAGFMRFAEPSNHDHNHDDGIGT